MQALIADQGWVCVSPSECNPGLIAPTVQRGDKLIDLGASPHLVLPAKGGTSLCSVFLCGTGCTPVENNPCTWFLRSSLSCGLPTIALCYQWGNTSDADRNTSCASKGGQSRVEDYHRDVLFGGNASGLVEVAASSSVASRLTFLLEHLVRTRPSEEGWAQFLLVEHSDSDSNSERGNADEPTRRLRWDRFIFSGHSQGSGHVALLAKTKPLAGAIFVSGPQELMIPEELNPTSWLTGSWETSAIYAFAHTDEELTTALIRRNWQVIAPLKYSPAIGSTSHDHDHDHDNDHYNDRPPNRTFSTSILPNPDHGEFGGRPNHNSTICDANTPMLMPMSKAAYFDLWSRLFANIVKEAQQQQQQQEQQQQQSRLGPSNVKRSHL